MQQDLVEGRSAVNTVAPWPSYADSQARVLHVQNKLHKWAATDQQQKLRDLFNLVYDLGTLRVAWQRVRANRGSRSAGADGVTCSYIEENVGVESFLRDIRSRLKDGTYRPIPVRERAIPKKGSKKVRRLGIPSVTDRVVQMALKLVLEPIFEPDQYRSSYAYRPGRRAQDAVAEIVHYINNGYTWAVEGDIAGCFDNIRHDVVVERIRRRITDRRTVNLCKEFLKAGVLTELGRVERRLTGTPQGGVISPLFANLALTALDEPFEEFWAATSKYRQQRNYLRSKGLATYRLIRYSDDFVIMVHGNQAQAEELRTKTAQLLENQGLTLSVEKTHITHVDVGFDFLGFRIQRRPREGKTPCAYTFMSKANLNAVKQKVKALTRRNRLNLSLVEVLMTINPILRGVANYFQHAAVKRTLHYLSYYTWWRVMRWLRAKHPKANWKWFKERYWGKDKIAAAGVVLFRPDSVPVTRYRYRGARIPTPWNAEMLNA